MADTSPETRGGAGHVPLRQPLLYVTDDVAVDGLSAALRVAGYAVLEVTLDTLAATCEAQLPELVLLDVDREPALEVVAQVRTLPGALAIDFIYFASGTGAIKTVEEAIANEATAFFPRPVDRAALLRRLEVLTGGPAHVPVSVSIPPPSLVPDRSTVAPPLRRTSEPPPSSSEPSLSELVESPRSIATPGVVSNELQQLLAEAEARAEAMPHSEKDSHVPTPEEEIETVLPADLLASLDEPIEGIEDDEHEPRVATGVGHDLEGGKPTTSGGGSKPTTSSGRATGTQQTSERRLGTDASEVIPGLRAAPRISSAPSFELPRSPSLSDALRAEVGRASGLPSELRMTTLPVEALSAETMTPSQAPDRGLSEAPAQSPSFGIVILDALDARRFVADAISRRLTGALCFEYERVVRRIVVRDGDLVTAASGDEGESLVAFLSARGELPRDEVERLAARVPPYGRHAGAALVAHGWLGQEQLWPTLRAHAEWLASAILRLPGGTAQLEAEPPGRLRSEPSVFGASTGAENFVELVRRTVPPEEAIAALGGDASRIADGPEAALLGECSLAPAELDLLTRSRGGTLGELLARSPEGEIASVVHGLDLLGVLEVVRAVHRSAPVVSSAHDEEAKLLDEEAIRARVRARLDLVYEGDYFSLLGVGRDATSYEVRRAFLELRRAFEPSRILTPRLHDLEGDVRKIVVVLEEAYEILRDNARRERYRRAIDARPA